MRAGVSLMRVMVPGMMVSVYEGHLIEINAILDGDGGLSFDIAYCGACL